MSGRITNALHPRGYSKQEFDDASHIVSGISPRVFRRTESHKKE